MYSAIQGEFYFEAQYRSGRMEEADESSFWLEFIIDEQLMKTNLVAPLLNEAKELTAIFYTSRKTAKKN